MSDVEKLGILGQNGNLKHCISQKLRNILKSIIEQKLLKITLSTIFMLYVFAKRPYLGVIGLVPQKDFSKYLENDKN